jgi:undecaprenyl-diphosphatase
MNTLQALVIAIIEGLTDFYLFLQRLTWVSLQRCWGWKKQSFKDVSVSIQFGAILAIVVLYWKKFFDFKNFTFYLKWLLLCYQL